MVSAVIACSSSSTDPCRDFSTAATAACAPSPGAPKFAGVSSLAPDATGARFRVLWPPASAAKGTPTYRVYVSTHAKRELATAPAFTTDPGANEAWIQPPTATQTQYVVVRAVDDSGLEDGNVVEKSILLSADTKPPQFAGVHAAVPATPEGVSLSWDAATDDATSPDGITYAIYADTAPALGRLPIAVTAPGATSITLLRQGVPGSSRTYYVRARDAAGNEDSNTVSVAATVGANNLPPTFSGCDSVEPQGSTGILVHWSPATADFTAASEIRYDIYVGSTAGGEDFSKPAQLIAGQLSVKLPVVPGSTSYVVCRARDTSNNEDMNTKEVVATVSSETTAPTFGGVAPNPTIDPASRTAVLSWAPATDGKTAAANIVYSVYQGTASTKEDFTTPVAVTAPGATQVTLKNLPPAATVFWVVRARNDGWIYDANTVEASGTTWVSFSLNVSPILAANCAVIGCHVPGPGLGGLVLSSSFVYADLVGVTALEQPPKLSGMAYVTPMDPDNSYLMRKIVGAPGTIVGSQMPAPQTNNSLSAADIATVKAWIQNGALNN